MAITFDRINKYIEIPSPDTEITIQNLLNAVREYEDNIGSVDLKDMANAYGKQDLGGSVLVGITLELLDGWRVKFEDRPGPSTISCSITGGNIVAYDEAGASQFPVVASTYVFVTISSSSSATLQEQSAIQFSSFNGGVTVDMNGGTAGTEFPAGTPQQPVDTISDAMAIATDRGFKKLYIIGSGTFTTGDDLSEMLVIGQDQILSTLIVESGADVTSSKFQDCILTGTLDGGNRLHACRIQDLNYVNGYIESCLLEEYTITLGGGSNATFLNCWSGVPGTGVPIINMGGSGQSLNLSGYSGDIKITNKTGDEPISIDIDQGKVIVDTTVTAGIIYIRGTADIYNYGSATVNDDGCTTKQGDKLAKAADVWAR